MKTADYLASLRTVARQHPEVFSAQELEALESWITAIESDPDKQAICEWIQLAAGACILVSENQEKYQEVEP